MSYKGTVIEGRLELDEPIPLTSGTRVAVDVEPEAKPASLLRMAGSLSDEDADILLQGAQF